VIQNEPFGKSPCDLLGPLIGQSKAIRRYERTRLSRAGDLWQVGHDIGYPVEKLPQVPRPTDDDYWEFVSDLSFPEPSFRRAPDARAAFLRRVAALDSG